MTNGEYMIIKAQIAVLRDLLADYSHKTLDNVLQGLEARVREAERTCITEGYNHEEDAMQVLRQLLL